MKVRITTVFLIMSLLTVTLISSATTPAGTTVTDLGITGFAFDINDSGQAVGRGVIADRTRAFLWTPSSGVVNLGILGGSGLAGSVAYGINSAGHVVGYSATAMGSIHAFLWTPADGMVDLGTLGFNESEASSINDREEVVGVAQTNDLYHAFLWTAGTGMVDLGTLGGRYSAATKINNSGQVVGFSQIASGETHAFLWTASTGMVDLTSGWAGSSEARDINDRGEIVGTIWNGASHAALWTLGRMLDLGTMGGPSSMAFGINDLGHVVGRSETSGGETHAFLWTPTQVMTDLGTLGGPNSGALSLNNFSQIAGESNISINPSTLHPTVWTLPPPTPVTIQTMIDGVTTLVSYGALRTGQANSLLKKLSQAAEQLDKNNRRAASSLLEACINETNGLIRSGSLTTGQGEPLVNAANQVIDAISR